MRSQNRAPNRSMVPCCGLALNKPLPCSMTLYIFRISLMTWTSECCKCKPLLCETGGHGAASDSSIDYNWDLFLARRPPNLGARGAIVIQIRLAKVHGILVSVCVSKASAMSTAASKSPCALRLLVCPAIFRSLPRAFTRIFPELRKYRDPGPVCVCVCVCAILQCLHAFPRIFFSQRPAYTRTLVRQSSAKTCTAVCKCCLRTFSDQVCFSECY